MFFICNQYVATLQSYIIIPTPVYLSVTIHMIRYMIMQIIIQNANNIKYKIKINRIHTTKLRSF